MSLKSIFVSMAAASLIAAGASAQQQPAVKPADEKPKTVPAEKVKPAKDTEPAKKDDKKEAAKPTLGVGDAAPAISVDKWVKGDAVTGFEKGKVYVVEFWATWCPPCREAIPHLTEMQKAHKDVVFMGIAGSERKRGETDDRLEKVEKFVAAQGDKMDYRVAYDSKRAMPESWLRPAGRNGIPCAFVVDGEGKIAWIGNPLGEAKKMEAAIEEASKKTSGKA